MFSGIASKKGLLAKKGAAADVTPNALNWTAASDLTSTTQTITGINTSITLRINNSSSYSGVGYFSVYINNVGYNMAESIQNDGFFDFVVSNNDVIYFDTASSTFSFDIINLSDGNALLDTLELGGAGGA
jgi:hypothetical protein